MAHDSSWGPAETGARLRVQQSRLRSSEETLLPAEARSRGLVQLLEGLASSMSNTKGGPVWGRNQGWLRGPRGRRTWARRPRWLGWVERGESAHAPRFGGPPAPATATHSPAALGSHAAHSCTRKKAPSTARHYDDHQRHPHGLGHAATPGLPSRTALRGHSGGVRRPRHRPWPQAGMNLLPGR